MFCGSKDMSAECGLWRENAASVKEIVGGVWSRRANLSSGSKDMSAECGLWRENAERVKGHVGGVWSRRANLPSGSKDLSVECGLGGEFAERVKKAVGGVWPRRRTCRAGQRTCRWSVVCGEKTPRRSKKLSAECGLWRENAERVKGHVGGVWSRARNHCAGQRSKTPPQ